MRLNPLALWQGKDEWLNIQFDADEDIKKEVLHALFVHHIHFPSPICYVFHSRFRDLRTSLSSDLPQSHISGAGQVNSEGLLQNMAQSAPGEG